MLLGLNCGRVLQSLALPEPAKALSSKHDFDLQVNRYTFEVFLFCLY